MTPTSIRRFIWGITIFSAGLVLLLQSVEILPGYAWKFVWPTFIALIGLEMMITAVYTGGEEIEIEVPKFWFTKTKKKAKK